ncbi:MAG TPA: choice-of-anchor Q domain-containing protein [Polyangia bacterium]
MKYLSVGIFAAFAAQACTSSGGYVSSALGVVGTGGDSSAAGMSGADGSGGRIGGTASGGSGTASGGSGTGTASGGSGTGTGGRTGSGGVVASGGRTGTGGATTSGSGGARQTNTCGNGQIESGESCDGSSLNGSSCTSLGFTSGTLACGPSCAFDTSACVGSVTVNVTASRTTCAAPCAVFFDATSSSGLMNNDYVGAIFNWDFDSTNTNPAGLHRTTQGFLTAHVFEIPGTYKVSVRGRDLANHSGTTSVSITVSAMTGTTYYVASSGNDSNSGTSMAQPLATVKAGLSHAGPQISVLLRRGDTFNVGTTSVSTSATGPFLFGAYTDPASSSTNAPIIMSSVSSSNWMGDVNNSKDLRMTDLHFVAGSGITQGLQVVGSTDALFERVEIEGVALPAAGGVNILIEDVSDRTFVVDSHLHDFNGLGIYGDRSKHFALIGSNIEKYTGADHGVRIQGGNDQLTGMALSSYVADNSITPTVGGGAFDSICFRGDNTNIVEVNNYYTSTVSFTPQNDQRLEHISNVLYDSNILDAKVTTMMTGLSIKAQHVYIRNSIVINTDVAFEIDGHPLLPANYVDQIFLYNNTVYGRTSGSGQLRFMIHGITGAVTSGNVTATNNIWSIGGSAANSTWVDAQGGGTETLDHNLWYSSGATLTNPRAGTNSINANPMFVSTDLTGTTAFTLQAASPAVDKGVMVPNYQDLASAPRPQGAGWDIGAYELKAASSALAAPAAQDLQHEDVAASPATSR